MGRRRLAHSRAFGGLPARPQRPATHIGATGFFDSHDADKAGRSKLNFSSVRLPEVFADPLKLGCRRWLLPTCQKPFLGRCFQGNDGHFCCSYECADAGDKVDLSHVQPSGAARRLHWLYGLRLLRLTRRLRLMTSNTILTSVRRHMADDGRRRRASGPIPEPNPSLFAAWVF